MLAIEWSLTNDLGSPNHLSDQLRELSITAGFAKANDSDERLDPGEAPTPNFTPLPSLQERVLRYAPVVDRGVWEQRKVHTYFEWRDTLFTWIAIPDAKANANRELIVRVEMGFGMAMRSFTLSFTRRIACPARGTTVHVDERQDFSAALEPAGCLTSLKLYTPDGQEVKETLDLISLVPTWNHSDQRLRPTSIDSLNRFYRMPIGNARTVRVMNQSPIDSDEPNYLEYWEGWGWVTLIERDRNAISVALNLDAASIPYKGEYADPIYEHRFPPQSFVGARKDLGRITLMRGGMIDLSASLSHPSQHARNEFEAWQRERIAAKDVEAETFLVKRSFGTRQLKLGQTHRLWINRSYVRLACSFRPDSKQYALNLRFSDAVAIGVVGLAGVTPIEAVFEQQWYCRVESAGEDGAHDYGRIAIRPGTTPFTEDEIISEIEAKRLDGFTLPRIFDATLFQRMGLVLEEGQAFTLMVYVDQRYPVQQSGVFGETTLISFAPEKVWKKHSSFFDQSAMEERDRERSIPRFGGRVAMTVTMPKWPREHLIGAEFWLEVSSARWPARRFSIHKGSFPSEPGGKSASFEFHAWLFGNQQYTVIVQPRFPHAWGFSEDFELSLPFLPNWDEARTRSAISVNLTTEDDPPGMSAEPVDRFRSRFKCGETYLDSIACSARYTGFADQVEYSSHFSSDAGGVSASAVSGAPIALIDGDAEIAFPPAEFRDGDSLEYWNAVLYPDHLRRRERTARSTIKLPERVRLEMQGLGRRAGMLKVELSRPTESVSLSFWWIGEKRVSLWLSPGPATLRVEFDGRTHGQSFQIVKRVDLTSHGIVVVHPPRSETQVIRRLASDEEAQSKRHMVLNLPRSSSMMSDWWLRTAYTHEGEVRYHSFPFKTQASSTSVIPIGKNDVEYWLYPPSCIIDANGWELAPIYFTPPLEGNAEINLEDCKYRAPSLNNLVEERVGQSFPAQLEITLPASVEQELRDSGAGPVAQVFSMRESRYEMLREHFDFESNDGIRLMHWHGPSELMQEVSLIPGALSISGLNPAEAQVLLVAFRSGGEEIGKYRSSRNVFGNPGGSEPARVHYALLRVQASGEVQVLSPDWNERDVKY